MMSRLFWNLNRKKDRLCHDAEYILNRKILIVYDIVLLGYFESQFGLCIGLI